MQSRTTTGLTAAGSAPPAPRQGRFCSGGCTPPARALNPRGSLGRVGALVLAAFVLASAAPGAQAQAAADTAIAAEFWRRAVELFRAGADDAALNLLGRSLEFEPRFSESLYLQALIHMKRQETVLLARSALESALAGGRWVVTSPREAQTELARVYVRTRRYAAADSLLRVAAPDRGLGGEGTAALAELWARTLIGRGRPEEAEELLERALRRFPGEPELAVLSAGLLSGRGRTGQAVEVLDRALGQLPELPGLLEARIRVEADRARREELLRRYFDAGGADPEAALTALLDLLAGEPAPSPGGEGPVAVSARADAARAATAALERYLELEGDRRVLLTDRLRGFLLERHGAADEAERVELYGPLLERLEAALAGFTGTRIVDADRDGRYEELYEYRGGALSAWLLDGDQDGLPEVRLEYEAGQPLRLAVFSAAAGSGPDAVEYLYSRYPYVRQVAFTDGAARRAYELPPFRYTHQAVEPRPAGPGLPEQPGAGHPLRVRRQAGSPLDEAGARRRAVRMAEYRLSDPPGGPADRLYTYLNGQIVRLEQEPDAQGRYRHYILYEGGRPVSGFRDLDGDGVFETQEIYSAGELREIRVDLDGDGNPEFVEIFSPGGRGGSEKRWDYNSDGRIDSRQISLPSGGVIREFSSRLDGRFDLRAVFREGRLQEFRRAGQLLPVRTVDPVREVYRIGSVGAWSSLPEPLTEGVHRAGGGRLFVFEHQGKTYVGEFE